MKKNYVCVVGFETDQVDKEGNPKIKKAKFLVQDVALFAAVTTLIEYLKTDMRGYDIMSISEVKFEEIIGQKTKSAVVKIN